MRCLLPALAVFLSTPALAAEVPRDGVVLDGDRRLLAGPGGDFPDGLRVGGERVPSLRVSPDGLIAAEAVDGAPRALAAAPRSVLIAPFWAPLAIGACPGEPPGEIRRAATPSGVRIAWLDVPLAGCPAEAQRATFSAELTVEAGVLRAVELRYEALPDGTLALDGAAIEPRAGLVARAADGAATVLELFPDPADGLLRGRAKLLLEGSSDGEPGVWTIELDVAGQIVGEGEVAPERPDGWRSTDNCEFHFNPLQEDMDGDGEGDACDNDIDGDRARNVEDNCPHIRNPVQEDADRDGRGDACDPDDDGDGWPDGLDLCPTVASPSNRDLDRDGRGDVCDPDADADDPWSLFVLGRRVPDRCPLVFDPLRADRDHDQLGDACDLQPDRPCFGDCDTQSDFDGDRIGDPVDLCPLVHDPPQGDFDGDGFGDACDPDANGDGVPDGEQLCRWLDCGPARRPVVGPSIPVEWPR